MITGAILLALLAGGLWFVRRDRPVGLSVDGAAIANADAVLEQAEAAFAELVMADGALPQESAKCWFAPPPAGKGVPRRGGPRVACGPVLLGVSGTDKPWVTGTVSYRRSNDESVGTFGRLTAVGALDMGRLSRRDGKRPPKPRNLAAPPIALRAPDGRRLTGDAQLVAAADQAFARAVARASAATAKDAGCWFGVAAGPTDRRISDGALWCGPVLLQSSRPDAPWTKWSVSPRNTEWFAVAELQPPSITTITTTVALPPATQLYRPDGRVAPDASGLALPDADPKQPGFTDVLLELPDDLQTQAPAGDGRFQIPSREVRIEAVARVPKMGSGKAAYVAAPGEELVVARFTRTEPRGGPSDRGTAQVLVGTGRIPLSKWASLPANGAIVLSVPRGTVPVVLEVLFDGVTQGISLTTGERSADARAALYRPVGAVGIGKPFQVSVPLPAGTSGVVTEARIDAWRERLGWAPAGRAFLTVTLGSQKTQTPCCAVSSVRVVPTWRLVLPTGGALAAKTVSGSSADAVVFEVPDWLTAGTLEVSATVTYRQGSTERQATGGPASVTLELPA